MNVPSTLFYHLANVLGHECPDYCVYEWGQHILLCELRFTTDMWDSRRKVKILFVTPGTKVRSTRLEREPNPMV